MSFAIKLRLRGKKRWAFLSSRGTNSLRVHAVQFTTAETARALIDENRDDNPEWEWRVVDFQSARIVQVKGSTDAVPT